MSPDTVRCVIFTSTSVRPFSKQPGELDLPLTTDDWGQEEGARGWRHGPLEPGRRLRLEHERVDAVLVRVPHLRIVEGGHSEVIEACHVVELNVDL